MSQSSPADRILFFGTAMLLLGVGVLMEIRVVTHYATYLVVPGIISILAGGVFAGAYYLPRGRVRGLLRSVTIMALNTAVLLGIVEGGCHAARVDFNSLLGVREKSEAFPIYFRMPADPTGEVFFKRSGPASWTGRPLSVFLKNNRGNDRTYEEEREVTIRYDGDGFRNPADLTDWEIVVAGDSFTESGYVEAPDLFTSVLADATGKRVKNLGVSDTGNLSHSSYLKDFGEAPSLQAGVLEFFEGNDLDDNVEEMRDLSEYVKSGERPSREIGRESSFVRVLYRFVRDFRKVKFGERSYANASFTAGGQSIPVSIADAPPAPEELGGEALEALDEAFDRWLAACDEAGAEAWLLYVPCKRRVFDGLVTQQENYPEPDWKLNRLPAFIQEKCEVRGIRFVDATPALRRQAAGGVMTFNTIYDTHLNREGHVTVGKVLAGAMAEPTGADSLVSVPAEDPE